MRTVQNMAVTLQIVVQRSNQWFDLYDHRTEVREGLEEIVRVTIFNDTGQRAAYSLTPVEHNNARRDHVRVGMLELDATGKSQGSINPIDSGWVDIPIGGSIDVSIAAHQAAVMEFCFTWAPAGAGVMEPRFNLGAFGGGVYHLKTSEEASPTITAPGWA